MLGHEGSGTVVEVGSNVSDFKPGDRVCMSVSYCGHCPACLSARPWACEAKLNFKGYMNDGTSRLSIGGTEMANFFGQSSFATYSVAHENNLVHVPDGMDLALASPLGCGIQTGAGTVLNYLKPPPGSSIVVSGCGAVGMSALMAAKVSGQYAPGRGTHGLKNSFAQHRYMECVQHDFSHERALQQVALELAHNRADVTLIYTKG